MDAAGVLPVFTGIAVHDAWAPYDCYPAATHALCNAHLLRELVAVTDTVGVDGRGWCWAEQVRIALLELKASVERAVAQGATAIDPVLLVLHTGHIRSAAMIAGHTACPVGDTVAARHRALARRILDRQADYLRFATDFRVPFDNDAVERASTNPANTSVPNRSISSGLLRHAPRGGPHDRQPHRASWPSTPLQDHQRT